MQVYTVSWTGAYIAKDQVFHSEEMVELIAGATAMRNRNVYLFLKIL